MSRYTSAVQPRPATLFKEEEKHLRVEDFLKEQVPMEVEKVEELVVEEKVEKSPVEETDSNLFLENVK